MANHVKQVDAQVRVLLDPPGPPLVLLQRVPPWHRALIQLCHYRQQKPQVMKVSGDKFARQLETIWAQRV